MSKYNVDLNGPVTINISNDEDELQLKFTDAFRTLGAVQQNQEFHEFLLYLREEIDILEEQDPNHQLISAVIQVCEKLLPHIDSNDLDLNKTITVTIGTSS